VHLNILAASGEHNVDHAALADTVNVTQARGGKIDPGDSAGVCPRGVSLTGKPTVENKGISSASDG
jgi:hypothetical protein